ncbi:MAG: response regulator [Verrucomicrobia bacterium]|nr:response regulator [Verrucomicrobiota bacterium]
MVKKLLFIEDDTIVGRMYQCCLQLEGFQVELVGDGKTGLDALHRLKPDLVILDLMLPKVNGVQILKHLRSRPETSSLPVIVLTNAYLNRMVEEAQQCGAHVCLTKAETPPARLVEAVRKTLAIGGSATGNLLPIFSPAGGRATDRRSEVGGAAAMPDSNNAFWEYAPYTANRMRGLARELLKIDEQESQVALISSLYESVHILGGAAALFGAPAVTRMATALEAFLKELEERPSRISSSSVRTLGQACEFVGELLDHRHSLSVTKPSPAYRVLVVDDDPLTLEAVRHALGRADFKTQCVGDPLAACQLLAAHPFDLAIIDVHMPEMDGYELCKKVHALPELRVLPVIFLTRMNDFDHRVRSALSGGVDFIGKPFLFMELTVKALIHVLRWHLAVRPTKDESFKPLA